ncbi:MAG TPA: helix-turn-helix domain-containing protein [Mycobacteriales bacterium]
MRTPAAPVDADTDALAAAVARQMPALIARAKARLGELPWFTALDANTRANIHLVVQGGAAGFHRWLLEPGRESTADDAFAAVPRALTQTVSLEQTVELVSEAVQAFEDAVPEVAPDAQAELRSAVERYGRALAFAVARVYARAAEKRGAWDARLQALVVDALLAAEADDDRVVAARAAVLEWPATEAVRVIAARPRRSGDALLAALATNGFRTLAAVHGDVVVVVVPAGSAATVASALSAAASGVVVGDEAPTLPGAGPSARAALGGLEVLPARPGQTVLDAADLLPERALAGDAEARVALVDQGFAPLDTDLRDTFDALVSAGGALETAARSLPVHVNTLRNRLAKIEALTGYDPREARGRFALQVAAVYGRLAAR